MSVVARLLLVALAIGAPAVSAAAKAPAVDIPFEQLTLPNGLRVVVHTDKKAPIVAVSVWYHVGSRDEPAGRSGFAHLFEHLMFNGSENHRGEYFEPFELVGATDMNGTTWFDRTNYFQNVPTTAVDLALWMESDRMGHLLGAIDQAVLDEQRGVVQNEKRQGENQPYGQVEDELYKLLYPKGHPYHHSTIGSMNDLNAASLDDVKGWFRAAYGPNNAVIVLAGDIDLATAKEKVTRFFGDIPPGPAFSHPKAGPANAKPIRGAMTDKVPQARIQRAYSVAKFGDADLDRLHVLSQILGGSKSSRLDERLLFKDKLVDRVWTNVDDFEVASTFTIGADVKAGVDPAKVEAAIDEELRRLLKDGPTAAEVAQARTFLKANFIRGVERIGGFSGKASALAECAVYAGTPGCFRASLGALDAATPANVKATGKKWLGKGGATMVVTPGERTVIPEEPAAAPAAMKLPAIDKKLKASASVVDRTKGVPMPEGFPALAFPAFQRAKLKNGTQLILLERHGVPVVQASWLFRGGYSADQGKKLGTAGFTMGMLDEGAGTLDALAFGNKMEALGARISAGAGLDGGNVDLSALKEHLDESVALYASVLREPRFDQNEIDRVRATWIAGIKQEKAEPQGSALRVLPPLLYGAGHPYAMPFTGTGTEESIASLVRDDLVAFQQAWLRPEGSTLVVVGDTTLAEMVPLLDKHLGSWAGGGVAPTAPVVAAVKLPARPRVFLVDQPGAIQATIFLGQVVPPTKDAGATQLAVANGVLGGEFSSRLNMNLREDKHWAYGSYSFLLDAVGQRPWLAFAPVQIDKTVDALRELQREIGGYATGKAPAKPEELKKIQSTEVLGLPGSYETAAAVLRTVADIVRYGRPDDWVAKRKAEIEGMTLPQVNKAAGTIAPAAITWVVVGDLAKIEAGVRALNVGEVSVVD
ncbi:MAG: peptidase M16, partial [Deltaproteobacteria bacterium RBG_16_71_12]